MSASMSITSDEDMSLEVKVSHDEDGGACLEVDTDGPGVLTVRVNGSNYGPRESYDVTIPTYQAEALARLLEFARKGMDAEIASVRADNVSDQEAADRLGTFILAHTLVPRLESWAVAHSPRRDG